MTVNVCVQCEPGPCTASPAVTLPAVLGGDTVIITPVHKRKSKPCEGKSLTEVTWLRGRDVLVNVQQPALQGKRVSLVMFASGLGLHQDITDPGRDLPGSSQSRDEMAWSSAAYQISATQAQ